MSRIITFIGAAGVAVSLASLTAAAQQTQTGTQTTGAQAGAVHQMDMSKVADRDSDFIKDVAQSTQVELAASRLAFQKATNPEVRAFAEQLIKEHTAADKELQTFVHGKHVSWKEDDPGLKLKKQKHESLEKLTGAAFDKEYLEDMISDHESAIVVFAKQKLDGKDVALKAFAEKTEPALREHLRLARELRAKLFK